MEAPTRPTTVRLLELEAAAQAAARATGLGLADWIRRAVAAALPEASQVVQGDAAALAGQIRVTLRVERQDLERWREAASQQGMSLNRYVATELSATTDARCRISAALDVVAAEAAAFAAVGRQLNQIARSLNAYPGPISEAERARLGELCIEVARHRTASSALVSAVRARAGRGEVRHE